MPCFSEVFSKSVLDAFRRANCIRHFDEIREQELRAYTSEIQEYSAGWRLLNSKKKPNIKYNRPKENDGR